MTSPELARALTERSAELGRQVGTLINRRGQIEYVVVGDATKITLPDVGRQRAGLGRLRGLRLVHTHLRSEPLTRSNNMPVAVFGRSVGSIDAYAAATGRWLVTRDGFDFLFYYLPDYDFASHALGPRATQEALARSDAAIAALIEAAGGPDEFLERYAVIVCSDHGQTPVEQMVSLEESYASVDDVVVTASNRAGQVYRLPGCREDAAGLARRLDGDRAAGVVLYREDSEAVAWRDGEELRFAPADGAWRTTGDPALLDQPDALERAWRALANPNAGDLLVSAAPGVELLDLAGRGHLGGGSHGSLDAADSEVPMLTVGVDAEPPRKITELAPLVLRHFGVAPPAYAGRLPDAA